MAWGCDVVLGYVLLGILRFVCSTLTSSFLEHHDPLECFLLLIQIRGLYSEIFHASSSQIQLQC